jgi:hypothetical protein
MSNPPSISVPPKCECGHLESSHVKFSPVGDSGFYGCIECSQFGFGDSLRCRFFVGASPSSPNLTEEQFQAGLSEARRIINQSAGYYFGGELTPFADPFKSLALRAINRLESPPSIQSSPETLPLPSNVLEAIDAYGGAQYWSGNGQGRITEIVVARSNLENLFREQQKEIERLRCELKTNGLTFEQKYILGRVAYLLTNGEDGSPIQWDKLIPELSSLKKEQLKNE